MHRASHHRNLHKLQDVDLHRKEIVVHDAKGRKDRVTMLPVAVVKPLQAHLEKVHRLHTQDLARNLGRAPLPDAIVPQVL